MIVAAEPEHIELPVTQWRIRSTPICPHCRRPMTREAPGRTDKLLGYFYCPDCKLGSKSRDYLADRPYDPSR